MFRSISTDMSRYENRNSYIKQLTEGDIVRHRDGSVWVVKGCVHPHEGFVAIPRVVDGKKLKRLMEVEEMIKRYYLHYIRNLPEIGRDVPIVPVGDVLEVRRWSIDGRSCGNAFLRQIIQTFDLLGLSCGIAGSHLGGYSSAESDVDIHCLNSPDAYSRISSLYSLGVLKHLDFNEAIREAMEVSESLELKKHAELITKRYLQGVYKRRKVTIRIVDCSRVRGFLGPYVDFRRAELVVKITESDYRTPAILRADVVRASTLVNKDLHLLTHRLRFVELPVGTLLSIEGAIATNTSGNSIVNLDESKIEWLLLPSQSRATL
ncbi:MAG: hypothetical protein QXG17_06465 [Sulfolobales archaeon]